MWKSTCGKTKHVWLQIYTSSVIFTSEILEIFQWHYFLGDHNHWQFNMYNKGISYIGQVSCCSRIEGESTTHRSVHPECVSGWTAPQPKESREAAVSGEMNRHLDYIPVCDLTSCHLSYVYHCRPSPSFFPTRCKVVFYFPWSQL